MNDSESDNSCCSQFDTD